MDFTVGIITFSTTGLEHWPLQPFFLADMTDTIPIPYPASIIPIVIELLLLVTSTILCHWCSLRAPANVHLPDRCLQFLHCCFYCLLQLPVLIILVPRLERRTRAMVGSLKVLELWWSKKWYLTLSLWSKLVTTWPSLMMADTFSHITTLIIQKDERHQTQQTSMFDWVQPKLDGDSIWAYRWMLCPIMKCDLTCHNLGS